MVDRGQIHIDSVLARHNRFPCAHVYRYASYEESALERLAGTHATREVEVDNLLRQGELVDLYKVVREGVRIGNAVPRAKCLSIVIANPALMAITSQTPGQMALVNTLCWVTEVGRDVARAVV